MHASPIAGVFSRGNFYFPNSFNFIFSKSSLDFLLALGVAKAGGCVGLRNKVGLPARRHAATDAGSRAG